MGSGRNEFPALIPSKAFHIERDDIGLFVLGKVFQ